MSNAFHLHCSQVPIGNNYIIRMGWQPSLHYGLVCTELWRTRGEAQWNELISELAWVCFPLQDEQREARCSIAPCQPAGNSVFRSCGLVWLLELEVYDGTLCSDTVLDGTAAIPEAWARHVCTSLGLPTAGMGSWFGDSWVKERPGEAQELGI